MVRTLTKWTFGPAAKTCLIAIGWLAALLLAEMPHGPEHWSADWRTSLLSKKYPAQYSSIALVEINNSTLKRLPYVSPIDRQLLSDLIAAVDAAEPKAIGIDIVFDRATEPRKDDILIDTIKNARSKIVIGVVDRESLEHEAADYQDNFIARTGRQVGHVYLDTSHSSPFVISDHVVREIAEPRKGSTPRAGLAQELAAAVGSKFHVDDSHISWLLPPVDGSETFLTLPADSITGVSPDGVPSLGALLRDKVVLIGGRFPDRDQHLTPLSVRYGTRSSGLFIHAQILRQILDGETLHSFQKWYVQLVIAAVVFVLGWQVSSRYLHTPGSHVAFEVVFALTIILFGFFCFAVFHTLIPFVSVWLAAIAGGTIEHAWRETREFHEVKSKVGYRDAP